MENKLKDSEDELSALRKKVDSDAAKFREDVRAWEANRKEMQEKLEASKAEEDKLKESASNVEKKCVELTAQLAEQKEKLALAESSLNRSSALISRQDSTTTTESSKVRDLQLQLNQARNELNGLREQLTTTRSATSQYKEIADVAEKRMNETNAAAKALKDDLEAKMTKVNDEKAEVMKAMETLKAERGPTDFERLEGAEKEAQAIQGRFDAASKALEETKAELARQSQLAQEAQEQFRRELQSHSKDIDELTQMKAELASIKNMANSTEEAKRAAEEALEQIRIRSESAEAMHKAEGEKLQEQLNVLNSSNTALHSQLSTVMQQLSTYQKSFEGGEITPQMDR